MPPQASRVHSSSLGGLLYLINEGNWHERDAPNEPSQCIATDCVAQHGCQEDKPWVVYQHAFSHLGKCKITRTIVDKLLCQNTTPYKLSQM